MNTAECVPDGLLADMLASQQALGVVVTETGGATISTPLVGSLELSLYDGRRPTPAIASLAFDGIGGDRFQLRAEVISSEALVAAEQGNRSQTSKGRVGVEGKNPCEGDFALVTTIEVLNARGTFDTQAHTIDGSFWRRVAVDFDGANVGCGIGTVHGRFVVDLTPSRLAYNCDHTFQIVGAIEATPDAGPDAQ